MDIESTRSKGKIPISIATSLAIESLLNIHDEVTHPKPLYMDNQSLYINVKTLFRNLYGSAPREAIDRTSNNDLLDMLIEEIELIKEVCKNDANGMDYHFYLPNYTGLESSTSETLMWMDRTILQKRYTSRMQSILLSLIKHYNGNLKEVSNPEEMANRDNIMVYRNKVKREEQQNVLMLTHYPYDLLAFRQFRRLQLLESHTGHVKGRNLWYTKYQNGKSLPEMPFRLDLLTLMGDGYLFRCKVPALRAALIELAQTHHWSALTTSMKIKENVKTIKNHAIRERLLKCISAI